MKCHNNAKSQSSSKYSSLSSSSSAEDAFTYSGLSVDFLVFRLLVLFSGLDGVFCLACLGELFAEDDVEEEEEDFPEGDLEVLVAGDRKDSWLLLAVGDWEI